jgi:hypothetical protein
MLHESKALKHGHYRGQTSSTCMSIILNDCAQQLATATYFDSVVERDTQFWFFEDQQTKINQNIS